jgi:DNA-binding NarL/FixJ family response regulator
MPSYPLHGTIMDKKIRVSYVEDHKVVREGVNFLLSQYPFLEIIQQELDAEKIDEFVARYKPDIFILDILLQTNFDKRTINGFELCKIIKSRYPSIQVIAHSIYDDVESANKIFRNGGMGFVSKKAGHLELINAIKIVSENKRYICREMINKVKNSVKFLKGEDEELKAISETFTKAEKSILERIARGFSTKQIAQQLEISEKTVETHRKHLFVKAKVKNVAELIAFAYSRRIFID